jgi:hypothetical protein
VIGCNQEEKWAACVENASALVKANPEHPAEWINRLENNPTKACETKGSCSNKTVKFAWVKHPMAPGMGLFNYAVSASTSWSNKP